MVRSSRTEIIARAVVLREDQVLTARQRGKKWHFLPGGHVEDGEAVERALVRELQEELGLQAIVKEFIGIVEHSYLEDGARHHELNLVFEADLGKATPASQEDHLEFTWMPLSTLLDTDLRPGPLKTAFQRWLDDPVPFWRPAGTDR